MSIKYYTHFVLRLPLPTGVNSFFGVVELNRAVSHGDPKQAAAVLAKNFDCQSKDITILQWGRLH
jgi:hypothetical protein